MTRRRFRTIPLNDEPVLHALGLRQEETRS